MKRLKAIIVDLRIKIAAAKTLIKEAGFAKVHKILKGMKKRKKENQPFGDMPPVNDKKDIESRKLIGDAILLYRELKDIYPERAEEIARKVITASAIAQLKTLIPIINKRKTLKLDKQKRKEVFCNIINRFPNADWKIKNAEDFEYSFIIKRCRLVELIEAAGHPELKDAFCEGDGIYFSNYQGDVNFSRPYKIGSGDEICDFNFEIKK